MEHELLVILASTMTKDQVIERLEQALSEYKEAELIGNEEEIEAKNHHLLLSCHLFILHTITGGDMSKAMSTIKQMDKMRQRDKIFSVDDKQN